jgi:cytochrome c
MASLEMNKIAGAILAAGLVAMVSGFIADELVKPQQATTEAPAGAVAPAQPAGPVAIEPVSPLLAKADVAAGQQTARQCQACHDFTKGGPNKIGPNLWGVVGSKPGEVAGYAFSDAMKQRASKPWTYEELNKFLAGPRSDVPGTKMTFVGLPKIQDRANVIAWLRQQSDQPLPLPSDADIAAAQKDYEQAKTGAAKPAAATAATANAAPAQTQGTETGGAGAAPIAERLKQADPARGEQVSKKCAACHDFTKGGPNKVGPNLWGIVGSHPADVANYSFSDAMKARKDKTWTFEELDSFLAGPRNYVPGTKMTFAGLPKPEDRADLIAWLSKQSDQPLPLPK